MIILAIETSCDETAAAVVKYDRGCFDIKSNIIASQVEIHSKYGGIVPEVAARKHVENIIPVVDEALGELNEGKGLNKKKGERIPRCDSFDATQDRSGQEKEKGPLDAARGTERRKEDLVDAIAVVNGPGLITSLLVGVEAGKALALAWGKPLIAINHLEAHIYSTIFNFQFSIFKESLFPALALIVSGGHTQLVLMADHGKYEVVGETRDDAAGEAFDKVGKLLGLGYPGGPIVSEWAEKVGNFRNKKQETRNKDTLRHGSGQARKFQIPNSKYTNKIELPRPMLKSKDFDFSFSGLKTAVLYEVRKKKRERKNEEYVSCVCAEFQQAVVDVLVAKTVRAAKKYKVKTVILSGGVSANRELRKQMAEAVKKELPSSDFRLPSPGLSTDNAVMVGIAGVYHYEKKDFVKIEDLKVDPNLGLE